MTLTFKNLKKMTLSFENLKKMTLSFENLKKMTLTFENLKKKPLTFENLKKHIVANNKIVVAVFVVVHCTVLTMSSLQREAFGKPFTTSSTAFLKCIHNIICAGLGICSLVFHANRYSFLTKSFAHFKRANRSFCSFGKEQEERFTLLF